MSRPVDAVKRIFFNRRTSKTYFYFGLTALVVILLSHTIYNRGENIEYIYQTLQDTAKEKGSDALRNSLSQIKIQPIKEIPVTPLELIPEYDKMVNLKKDALWNPMNKQYYKNFQDLDLENRCKFYFRHLYTMNKDWTNDLKRVSFYINDIDTKQMNSLKDSDGILLADKETVKLHKRRNDIGLVFQRQRLYDQCFILNDHINIQDIFVSDDKFIPDSEIFEEVPPQMKKRNLGVDKEDVETSKSKRDTMKDDAYTKYDQFDFERRMFPFVSHYNATTFANIMPEFSFGDGKYSKPGEIPTFDEEGKFRGYKTYEYDSNKTFLANWNEMSKRVTKRGIVLSFADGHLSFALKLISTLRFQGNKFPIQVIHKSGDLKEETMKILHYAATSSDVKLPETEIDEENTPVPQELIFVNISKTLHKDYSNTFHGFKNKWLAVIFNLVQEFIFLDIDAINYVDLNDYFDMKEYKETGTIFFRDRMLNFGLNNKCVPIFDTLQPKLLEGKYFQHVPFIDKEYVSDECEKYLTTEEMIYKRYFEDGRQHQMESGLIVVDKNRHIIPLIMAYLLHDAKKTGACNYGDKDYFWLGFLVSAHKYSFHSVNAGTIGHYDVHKKDGDNIESRICAIQLAHMSHDDHLLWLNGGSNVCKFPDAEKEYYNDKFKHMTNKFKDFESFQKYYNYDPIESEYAIVAANRYDAWGGYIGNCRGYAWCVNYSNKLKDFSFDERIERGHLIKFKKQERKRIHAINIVWARLNDTEIVDNAKRFINKKN